MVICKVPHVVILEYYYRIFPGQKVRAVQDGSVQLAASPHLRCNRDFHRDDSEARFKVILGVF